jgi:hypothetical protein
MPIMVNCTCGQVLAVEDVFAGKTIVCKQCQRVVPVPNVGPDAEAQPADGSSVANPYLQQNAGYAAEAAKDAYDGAPQQYFTKKDLGAKGANKTLLIAVVVLVAALAGVVVYFMTKG